MALIKCGILFERQAVPDCWEVSTWRKNGVLERSARPVYEVVEVGPAPEWMLVPCAEPDPIKDAEWLAEQRAEALQKAAQRAKTMCRRVIITEGFDELLTITYRDNQQDRELCKKHFKEWVRRMKMALGHDKVYRDKQGKKRTKRVPGDFRYCASFERQERGAMHVHVACHKLPQSAQHKGVKIKGWELGTRVWRSIVGQDNGLVFVGGKPKNGNWRKKWTLAKMAAYVSKYIMKDYEESPSESNRYSRSNGINVGEVHRLRLRCSFLELIEVSFECGEGDVLVDFRVGKLKDSMWLCTETRERSIVPVH